MNIISSRSLIQDSIYYNLIESATHVAWIHSPVCDYVFSRYSQKFQEEYLFRIYARSYTPRTNNPNDHHISKFLDQSNAINEIFNKLEYPVILYIPHALSKTFRDMATNPKVESVFYIEEGELSYLPNSVMPEAAMPERKELINIKNNPNTIPHTSETFNIYEPQNSDLFFDTFDGKYAGVIGIFPESFPWEEDRKLSVGFEKDFKKPSDLTLLLITHPTDITLKIKRDFRQNNDTSEILLNVWRAIITSANILIDKNEINRSKIVVKFHPGTNKDVADIFHEKYFKETRSWTTFSENIGQNIVEPSFFPWRAVLSVGASSAIRYARKWNSEVVTKVIKDQVIEDMALTLI